MKKHFLSLLAIGAMVMTSCQNESFDDPNGNLNPGEDQGIGYMAFQISTDASTRATDDDWTDDDNETFNPGDASEYALAPNNRAHMAFFFDEETYYGASYLSAFNNVNDDDHNHGDVADDELSYVDTERFYTYITRWRNSDARNLPNQVLVLINYNPTELENIKSAIENESGNALEKLLTYTDNGKGSYVLNNTRYFSMSNSVFADKDDKTVNATQIEEGQICATPEQALDNRVTVYVERVLAKHTVTFDNQTLSADSNVILYTKDDDSNGYVYVVTKYTGEEGTDLDYPDYVKTKWGAYVSSWDMNGLERTTNIYKQITPASNYFTNWNNEGYHRSYWGESPNYEKGIYPTQYRDLVYEPNPFSQTAAGYNQFSSATSGTVFDNVTVNDYTLQFLSYNQLGGRAADRYSVERTYNLDKGRLGYGPYNHATHVLVAAQLVYADGDLDETENDKDSQNSELLNVADKWYAYNFMWQSEADYIRFSYRRLATNLADGLIHKIGDFEYRTTDDLMLYGSTRENGYITVEQATKFFKTAPAYLYHGDGKVTIARNDRNVNDIYVKAKRINNDGTEGEVEFVKLSDEELLGFIYDLTEAARHYNKGRMYYAVPIQHKLGQTLGETVKIDQKKGYNDNGDVNKEDMYALGQFGVVRNHWYRMNFKIKGSIGNLGTPVDDPDQPIIPDPEDEYAVAIEIVVLPWHVIDMGDVNL